MKEAMLVPGHDLIKSMSRYTHFTAEEAAARHAPREHAPSEPDSKVHETWQYLASRRVMSLMLAINVQAVALSKVFSQSFASLRQRPSQAKVRSTTHRRGSTSKPLAVSVRLMISMVQSPWPLRAALSLPPA